MNDSPSRPWKRWFVSRIGRPPKATSRPANRLVWACLLVAFGPQVAGSTRQIDSARFMASPPTQDHDRTMRDRRASQALHGVRADALYRWPGGGRHGFIFSSQAQTLPLNGACQLKGARLPAEVRIGYLKLANAQLVAKAQGLHEKAMCVPVRWIGFETGGQVNAAMAAGQIDFGAMGGPPASVGVTKGLGYRGILLLNLLQGVEGLVVRSAIATPADLAGKRIATPFGSTSHYLLNVLLKQTGQSPDGVSLLNMTPDQAAAAWTAGQIDAAYVWEPAIGRMTAQGGRILIDNADMADRGFPMWDIAVVSDTFASTYPDLVASYVRSECAAIDFWLLDPEVTAAAVASELDLPPAEAKRMIAGIGVVSCSQQTNPAYFGDTMTPGKLPRSIYDMAVFLRDSGLTQSLAEPADYEALIDTRYLAALNAPFSFTVKDPFTGADFRLAKSAIPALKHRGSQMTKLR